jgi:hypothetical protein
MADVPPYARIQAPGDPAWLWQYTGSGWTNYPLTVGCTATRAVLGPVLVRL